MHIWELLELGMSRKCLSSYFREKKFAFGAQPDVNNLNFTLPQAGIVGIIGPNGAGKSTFLRLVSGIYQPSSGVFRAHCPVFPMIQKSFITMIPGLYLFFYKLM